MLVAMYSSKLRCSFHGWRVLADGEIALDMPAGMCCDMTGAIEIALQIMPSVFRIETLAGGHSDMQYYCVGGKWSVSNVRAIVIS